MSFRRSLFARALLFSLSLAFAACLSASVAHAQPAGEAVLEGTITDAGTGDPLPGASVELPALDRGTSTGPDGAFRIANLPAGRQRVRVSFVGYRPTTRRVTLGGGEATTLDLALASATVRNEEVVVTGTPVAQNALTATQQIDVVSPQEMAVNRSASLGDLIAESVPGAASIQTGPQAGKPVLRGLSGNRVKLLMDNIGQEYYQYGVRHFPNTALVEARRVEVVRGPSSILYGSDALGGAINVIPRDIPQAGFGGTLAGQYYGNNDERAVNADLHAGGDVGGGTLGARGGIERRVAGNFTTPDEPTFFETENGGTFGDPKYTGEIPFTNFNQWTGYGQVGYEGDFGSVQVFGDYWKDEHNFLLPFGGSAGNADNPPVGLGQNIEHGNITLKGNLFAGDFVLKPRLAYQRAIRQSAGPGNTLDVVDEREENGGFDYPIDLQKDIYTGRLDVEHPAYGALGGEASGTIGTEISYEDGESTGPVPLEPTATVFRAGVYAFENLDLDPWTFSAGARLDYRTLESSPPGETIEALRLTDGDLENDYTTLSGSLGANYRLADGWALAANLGTGFRAPSIFELYANGQHGGVAAFQRGNPNLSPERSYSADLGIRARTDRLTGELTGYVTAIQNYVFLENTGATLNPDGGGPPIYRSGQTDARIAGLEGRIRVNVLPWLAVGGDAALLTSSGDDLDGGDDGTLPLIPANRLSGLVRAEAETLADGTFDAPFVQARLRHAFEQGAAGRYEPFSQFDADFGPPFGTASTEGYTLLDVTAGATLPLGPASPRLTLGARNLFDTTYRSFLDTYKGYALSPGRNLFVKLAVPFGTGQ